MLQIPSEQKKENGKSYASPEAELIGFRLQDILTLSDDPEDTEEEPPVTSGSSGGGIPLPLDTFEP